MSANLTTCDARMTKIEFKWKKKLKTFQGNQFLFNQIFKKTKKFRKPNIF